MSKGKFLLYSTAAFSLMVGGVQTVSGSVQFVPRKGFQLEHPRMSFQNFNSGGMKQPDAWDKMRCKVINAFNRGRIDEHAAVIQLGNIAIMKEKEAEEAREATISRERIEKEPIKIDKLKEYFVEFPNEKKCKSEMDTKLDVCKDTRKNKQGKIDVAKLFVEAKEELGFKKNDERLCINKKGENVKEYEIDLTDKVITFEQLDRHISVTPQVIHKRYEKKRKKLVKLYKWKAVTLEELSEKLCRYDTEEDMIIKQVAQGRPVYKVDVALTQRESELFDLYRTLKANYEKLEEAKTKELPAPTMQRNVNNAIKTGYALIRKAVARGISALKQSWLLVKGYFSK